LAIGFVTLVFFSATAVASCATSNSDDEETDETDETEETEETEETNGCTQSQIECGNGDCISKTYACDGVPQCDDGADEFPLNTDCPESNCTAGYWGCTADECISLYSYCDGYTDCLNGSDEVGCGTCALPDQTPNTTCDQECSDAYDCGMLTCGHKLCSSFTGDTSQRTAVLTACMSTCEIYGVGFLVTPANCAQSVYQAVNYIPEYAAACAPMQEPGPEP